MTGLPDYIKINNIIDIYIDNADVVSPNRWQHFALRAAMCRIPRLKERDYADLSVTLERVRDIYNRYIKGEFAYIVDEYVCPPYRLNGKRNVLRWLENADETVKKYLSLGALSAELFIITRNNGIDKIDYWDGVYDIYNDIDALMELHNGGAAGLRDVNGTLYVNFIGNTYYLLKDERLRFGTRITLDDWRKTRKYFTDGECNMSNVYGVTHTVINGTEFYTKQLDVVEFSDELDYIETFLRNLRRGGYSNVGKEYTYDVVCEAAVCDMLAHDPRYCEWVYAKEFLLGRIDVKTHILQSVTGYERSLKDNLEHNEHCNILLVMLCRYVGVL